MIVSEQQKVSIVCDRPALTVVGVHGGESTPVSEGGRGGWVSTSRMRRTPLVEWSAPEEETYELELRLVPAVSSDVDGALRRLERMCRMPSENVAPPLVRVTGLVPIAGRVCAIQGYSVDDTIRAADGSYEHVLVTVSLLVADNTGDGVVVARRVPAVHIARKGDTIQRLATRYYLAPRHATVLYKAQSTAFKKRVRDIRAKIPPGTRVRLP